MADDASKNAAPDDLNALAATESAAPAPKRVIRTYASDVARLTGAPGTTPAAPAAVATKVKPAAPAAWQTPASLPPIKKTGEPAFAPKPAEPAAPTHEEIRRVLPAPSYEGPLVGSTFTPTTFQNENGEDTETRDQILARLRAKVDTYRAQNPAPPPVFPTPRPEAASAPARPMPPPPVAASSPASAAPEPLHTWSEDFSNHINDEQASAFSVLAAQADAPRPAPKPAAAAKSNRGLWYAVIATVLFVGGSTLLYLGFHYFEAKQPVPVVSNTPAALIVGDDETQISGSGSGLMLDLTNAAATPLPSGDVRIVYLSVPTTTPAGATNILEPGGDLIAALGLPAPDILLRNIGELSTVGIVNAAGETRVFFILAATSYERTFAGMLSWEPTIGRDLANLYPPVESPATATASTTASTTDASSTPFTIDAPAFVDEVVDSHDVRALKDDDGNTILLYGYRDQNTLIVARNEAAFSLLLSRLSATQAQ